MSSRQPPQKAKISTSPALRGNSNDGRSRRSVGSQEDLSNSSDNHRSVLLSPTANPRSSPGPKLSHRSSEAVEDKGKKSPQSSPTARLPLLFRSSPTLPPLITSCHARNSLHPTRAVPTQHRTNSHPIHLAFPGELREHGYDCPLADHYFPLGYKSPPGYSIPQTPSSTRHRSPLPPIHVHLAEYAPPPQSHYHSEGSYPPPPPSSAYMYSQREDAYHRPPRPRPLIHPHTHPMSTECDVRFHSARRLGHGSRLSYGLRLSPVKGPNGGALDSNTSSQASMVSAGKLAFSSIKSPRKRANDVQLAALSDAFRRTHYPSTKERHELAMQLGMTSRSVQIWFQNRRRAVKVDQESAIQRAEAKARAAEATWRELPAPPSLAEGMSGGSGSRRNSGAELENNMEVDVVVKRERQ
ncbi:hypothetical protein I309_03303 [Cryptococcus deuterogattii LA55]|nr:hypothetical protein I309_03303 [Cryptococcus deuterogattii LA55]KIR73153.1 hypothetical protein I310_02817 [Cryptococcus deuterogattii CA1014]KIR90070.1 hypothetical protein I304_06002 [Cryptococcus deuterogattii CBS 10090]